MTNEETKALRRYCGAVLEYRHLPPYKSHVKKACEDMKDGSVSDEQHDTIMKAIILNTLNRKDYPYNTLQRQYDLPMTRYEFTAKKNEFCAALAKRCGFPGTAAGSFSKKDILDMLFVAVLGMGVGSAAIATTVSQGISALLCFLLLIRSDATYRVELKKIRFHKKSLGNILRYGIPSGIQNSVISIANVFVQANINSFGKAAMAGCGSYSKLEGFAFLPVTCFTQALSTFVGQNLGAKNYSRAKKGAAFGVVFGIVTAELLGLLIYFAAPSLLKIFVDSDLSVTYGQTHLPITSLFYCLLALSHCSAGALRGCGKSFIPMITMLAFWCGVRVVYVNSILNYIPKFEMISWAYPITWTLSSIVLLVSLLTVKWDKAFEKKQ